MKKYYYTDGANTFGPFSIDELKEKRITGDTFIWWEGISDWVLAKSVSELNDIVSDDGQPYFSGVQQVNSPFSSVPNPNLRNTQNASSPPKTYLLETILTTIFCCWPLGIVSIIYAARVEKKFYAGDIVGAKIDSASAKKWMWINIGVCVGIWVLYFVFFGFAIFGILMSGSF